MPDEYDQDDSQRLRSALFGSDPLTRADAELLSRRFPYNGSGASKAFQVLGPIAFVYFAVLVVLGIVHHSSVGRLILPVIFVVFGVFAAVQRVRVKRKIRQALAAPTD